MKLKRNRRTAEQCLNDMSTMTFSVIRNARQAHFSKLTGDNQNNPKILFSTIDRLNPVPLDSGDLLSTSRCEEFAAYFRDKITTIRSGIAQLRSDALESPTSPCVFCPG